MIWRCLICLHRHWSVYVSYSEQHLLYLVIYTFLLLNRTFGALFRNSYWRDYLFVVPTKQWGDVAKHAFKIFSPSLLILHGLLQYYFFSCSIHWQQVGSDFVCMSTTAQNCLWRDHFVLLVPWATAVMAAEHSRFYGVCCRRETSGCVPFPFRRYSCFHMHIPGTGWILPSAF